MKTKPDDLISLRDAARINSCSRAAFYRLANSGKLQLHRVSGKTMVLQSEVDGLVVGRSYKPAGLGLVRTDLLLPADVKELLSDLASTAGVSMSQLAAAVISEALSAAPSTA